MSPVWGLGIFCVCVCTYKSVYLYTYTYTYKSVCQELSNLSHWYFMAVPFTACRFSVHMANSVPLWLPQKAGE